MEGSSRILSGDGKLYFLLYFKKDFPTVCVKDRDLNNQNFVMIILFACLVGCLDCSPLEIQKN